MQNKKLFAAVAITLFIVAVSPVLAANKVKLPKAVITEVSGTTITAIRNNKTYTINAERAVLKNASNKRATIGQFFTGDQIDVNGTMGADGIVTAKTIKDRSLKKEDLTRRVVGSDNLTDDVNSSLNIISSGNITGDKIQNATITGANLATDISINTTGNITAGNLTAAGQINAPSLCISGDCKTAWNQVGGGSTGASSISNSDETLTISPTTGAAVASLNLNHANSWSAAQTFSSDSFFPGSGIWDSSGNVGIGTESPPALLSVGSSSQLQVDSSGNLSIARTGVDTTDTSINATQTSKVQQDGSANTGTNTQVGAAYTAVKFTTPASGYDIGSFSVRMKASAALATGVHVYGRIYTDNAGVPGAQVVGSSYAQIFYSYLTTSYREVFYYTGNVSLAANTSYWLVLYAEQFPVTGGNILFDSTNAGTAQIATSADGSSWASANNITGWFKLHSRTGKAIYASSSSTASVYADSPVTTAIEGHSVGGYGLAGYSSNEMAVYGISSDDVGGWFIGNKLGGVQGISVDAYGVNGTSVNGSGGVFSTVGGYGISVWNNSATNVTGYFYQSNAAGGALAAVTAGSGTGVTGTSNSGYGGWFASTSNYGLNVSGVRGINSVGTTSYGVLGQSTSNYGVYGISSSSYSLAGYRSTSATNTVLGVLNLVRNSSGTTAAGIGGSIDWTIYNASGNQTTAAMISGLLTNASAGAETGALKFGTLTSSGNMSDKMILDNNGNVGIGTTAPAESLDVNGQMKLKINSAQPYACDASHNGAIAATNKYTTCICKNGTGWVLTSDGTTSCTWN